MERSKKTGNRGGFTLIELMIAVAVLGVVITIAVGTFREMAESYRVEEETKRLYADLMDARGRAMQRNRWAFVQVAGNGYSSAMDTAPAPDGNGIPEISDQRVAAQSGLHPIVCLPAGLSDLRFDRNGMAAATGTIRLSSNVEPAYDCINVRETRIRMGKWDGSACIEK